jgi:undecaprenyl pyrophosphate phosphatase UppP
VSGAACAGLLMGYTREAAARFMKFISGRSCLAFVAYRIALGRLAGRGRPQPVVKA